MRCFVFLAWKWHCFEFLCKSRQIILNFLILEHSRFPPKSYKTKGIKMFLWKKQTLLLRILNEWRIHGFALTAATKRTVTTPVLTMRNSSIMDFKWSSSVESFRSGNAWRSSSPVMPITSAQSIWNIKHYPNAIKYLNICTVSFDTRLTRTFAALSARDQTNHNVVNLPTYVDGIK